MAEKQINNCQVLLIGGSAGSLEVLLKVLPNIRVSSFAVVIVVHRKSSEDSTLEDLIAIKSALPLREVEDKTKLVPGSICIAPSGYHMLFEKNGLLSLDISEKVNHSRPSIDVSFESAADIYGSSVVGLLLSGANSDGTNGLIAIKSAGGFTAIQDPDDAEMDFMPRFAKSNAPIDFVLRVDEMISFIDAINSIQQ